jgi:hypothetical protein
LAHSLQKGTPSMTSTKYIGMDVHKESISIAVLNFAGKVVTMARLTLARKIAAITLIVWRKEVRFDANYLKQQAA